MTKARLQYIMAAIGMSSVMIPTHAYVLQIQTSARYPGHENMSNYIAQSAQLIKCQSL